MREVRIMLLVFMIAIGGVVASPPGDDPNYHKCDHIHDLVGDPRSSGYAAHLTTIGITTQVVYLCEKGPSGEGAYSVAFDAYNRIPLLAQTMLSSADLITDNTGRGGDAFDPSLLISVEYQAAKLDYEATNSRVPFYEKASNTGNLEHEPRYGTGTNSPVHQGHVIADQYMRDDDRKEATYRYTNIVPQFGPFNTGAWRACESRLVKQWADGNCKGDEMLGDWSMHIAVGTVPSAGADARWFGRYGFSDTRDMVSAITYANEAPKRDATKDPYRINVPAVMWTAACCVQLDAGGNVLKTKNVAFLRVNTPQRSKECPVTLESFSKLGFGTARPFPSIPECTSANTDRYVPLKRPRKTNNQKAIMKKTKKAKINKQKKP